MADILLAHSYHLPYDPKQVRKMQPYPPLGTLYAATALRQHGMSAAVFDPMLQDPVSGFLEILRHEKPAILAIYEDDFNFLSKMCLTRMRELAWQLAQTARDAEPSSSLTVRTQPTMPKSTCKTGPTLCW